LIQRHGQRKTVHVVSHYPEIPAATVIGYKAFMVICLRNTLKTELMNAPEQPSGYLQAIAV
jgi:hypothetical protein